MTPLTLSVADLPAPPLRNRFVGVTGKDLLMVYPKGDIWKRDVQKEFIDQVSPSVSTQNVTGTPVQLYHYTSLLKESYQGCGVVFARPRLRFWSYFTFEASCLRGACAPAGGGRSQSGSRWA